MEFIKCFGSTTDPERTNAQVAGVMARFVKRRVREYGASSFRLLAWTYGNPPVRINVMPTGDGGYKCVDAGGVSAGCYVSKPNVGDLAPAFRGIMRVVQCEKRREHTR